MKTLRICSICLLSVMLCLVVVDVKPVFCAAKITKEVKAAVKEAAGYSPIVLKGRTANVESAIAIATAKENQTAQNAAASATKVINSVYVDSSKVKVAATSADVMALLKKNKITSITQKDLDALIPTPKPGQTTSFNGEFVVAIKGKEVAVALTGEFKIFTSPHSYNVVSFSKTIFVPKNGKPLQIDLAALAKGEDGYQFGFTKKGKLALGPQYGGAVLYNKKGVLEAYVKKVIPKK